MLLKDSDNQGAVYFQAFCGTCGTKFHDAPEISKNFVYVMFKSGSRANLGEFHEDDCKR